MARPLPWLVPAVWAGGVIPLSLLGLQAATGDLGANPVEAALNQLGLLGLVALLATLACTPAMRLFRWTWPARVRKPLGLIAFGYVTLHLLTWAVVDQGLVLPALVKDVVKRPFITVGFTAWLLLVPLAWTSRAASLRALGFPRWKRLHRLAYLCAALGVVHFVWRAKKDVTEPLLYGAALAVLLVLRLGGPKRGAPAQP